MCPMYIWIYISDEIRINIGECTLAIDSNYGPKLCRNLSELYDLLVTRCQPFVLLVRHNQSRSITQNGSEKLTHLLLSISPLITSCRIINKFLFVWCQRNTARVDGIVIAAVYYIFYTITV